MVLFLAGRLLLEQFLSVRWSEIQFSPLLLAAGALMILVGQGLSVVAYRRVLAGFGPKLEWKQMSVIAYLPLAGKYVPGKVASVAGAVWLLHRNRVPTAVSVSVVFILNGLMVLVGLILAAPLTLCDPLKTMLPMGWLWFSLFGIVALVLLHPRAFKWVGNIVLKALRRQQLSSAPSVREYALVASVMLLQFALIGTGLWLIARSITEIAPVSIPFFVAAWAAGGTVGFLAFFAPGGIGVREAILLGLLGSVIGTPTAAIVAVGFRILHVLVELVLILFAAVLMKTEVSGAGALGKAQAVRSDSALTSKSHGD